MREKADAIVTHFVDFDEAIRRTREVRAACGLLVHRSEHRNDPTCEACRQELNRRNGLVIE